MVLPLYAELDRLKAEVTGLRELCQRQDQEIQALRQEDDWPMEYDEQTLNEVSPGQPVTRTEALRIARATLDKAEAERKEMQQLGENVLTPYGLELREAKAQRDDLLETLVDVLLQACGEGEGYWGSGRYTVDPMALSTYEEALELLKRLGYAKQLGNRRWELFPIGDRAS